MVAANIIEGVDGRLVIGSHVTGDVVTTARVVGRPSSAASLITDDGGREHVEGVRRTVGCQVAGHYF